MSSLAATSLENRLRQVISNIRDLPTPPIVFEQIQKAINSSDTSIANISTILSEDPAMSIKVLKLTNSAFYGLSREIDSVKQATMIIGLEAVKNLVLSASILSMFKAKPVNREYHEEFWRHSLATAVASRILAGKYKDGSIFNPDPAFSTGLIHDLGKMVICCFMPDEFEQIREYLVEHPETTAMEAEITVMGFHHGQLGSQLAATWKLPERMADSIGYHHTPAIQNKSADYAYLLNLSDYIAHITFPTENTKKRKHQPDPASVAYFGADEFFLEDTKKTLLDEYTKAESFMKIAGIG